MPFYRFEGMKSYRFNPHLSTADGPVIEGKTMYFRMVTKRADTGASACDSAAPNPCAGSRCEHACRVRIAGLMFMLASTSPRENHDPGGS